MRGFFKQLIYKESFTQATILIATTSLISRILGLFRDRIFAAKFGATRIVDATHSLDVYYAAFRVPDFIYNILILGALSAAFIPVFTSYITQKKYEQAEKIASSILNITLLSLFSFALLIFILAPYLVHLIVPGFDLEKKMATASLTRIMLVSPLFFGISNIFGGILNSYKRFFSYSLAPIFYNLGIIGGTVLLYNCCGIYGAAYGVITGAFLHMFVQFPEIKSLGFHFKAVLDLSHEAVKKIGKLMLPRMLGIGVTQINLVVQNIIASFLISGSVAILNLANNLQHFPVGLFGIPASVAVFPYLASAFSLKKNQEFVQNFSKAFRQILFFILPTTVGMVLLRAQIVRLVLGAGYFTWKDTILTLETLGFFCLSLFAQATIPLLSRTFYALQNTKTPVKIGALAVSVNIILSIILGPLMGVKGLALAFSLACFLNMGLLFYTLRRDIGELDEKSVLISGTKNLTASLLMGACVYATLHLVDPLVDTRTGLGLLCQTLIAFIVGLLVYLEIAKIFGCEEAKAIYKRFRNLSL